MAWLMRTIGAMAALLFACTSLPAVDSHKASLSPLDSERMRAEAELAERNAKWDRALEFYLKLYTSGHTTSEIRERIRFCCRNANQFARHRDPAFQQYLLTLSPADALTIYAEALGKIHTHYADRNRSTVDKLFAQGLFELEQALSDPAFREAHLPEVHEAKVAKFRQQLRELYPQKLPSHPRDAKLLAREIISQAQQQLGLKNPTVVIVELLCGACSGLDEFSAYQLPASTDRSELNSPILELASYGLLVGLDGRSLWIEGVWPNSWAAMNTPLQKGDSIVRWNGKLLDKPTLPGLALLLKSLRHQEAHEIEASRPAQDGGEELTYKLRLPRPVPTVYGSQLLNTKDGLGYLRIGCFRDSTPRELDEALDLLKRDGLRGLIVDLRGNPGGSFVAAIEVAKRFLASGLIGSTVGQLPEFSGSTYPAEASLSTLDMPVVLLVDTRTMSAAEVLAAALKDNNRAALVGTPTFGKGLIQCPVRLKVLDSEAATPVKAGSLFLSVGSAMTPRGAAIEGTGITPHIVERETTRQLDTALSKLAELLGAPPLMMIPAESMR